MTPNGPTRLALAVAALLVLSGCTSDDPNAPTHVASPSPTASTAQQSLITALLAADDEQPHMSDEQRTVLIDVLTTGELGFDQYAEAVHRTLACAEKAGLLIDGPRQSVQSGQTILVWGWRDPGQPDGDPRVGEACQSKHSAGIEAAYQNSDLARVDEASQLEAYRPQLLACLEAGEASPDDPTMEIFALLEYIDALEGPGAQGVFACVDAIGMEVG